MEWISNAFLNPRQSHRNVVYTIFRIATVRLLPSPRQSRPSSMRLSRRMMISTVRSTQNGNLIRNTRSYGTSHSTTTSQSSSSDKALMDELRRLSHRQDTTSQPMLGPFMMPREHTQEPALSGDDYRHWSQVSWPARIRRTFRLGRNLLIVSFGGCLGIMVIYSITSELFAPSSTTNLMSMTITTLEESEELNKMMEAPLTFHSSPPSSSSKRSSGVPQSVQHASGVLELRFWVERRYKPNRVEGDWRNMDWWRSWIGPLITSEVHPTSSSVPASTSEPNHPNSTHASASHDGSSESRWWPGLLKSIMPNTLARSSGSSHPPKSWSERFFSNPGQFERGEVVVELIKESNGHWKYKSLVVDFPDSQNVQYRLNVWNEVKKKKMKQQRLRGSEQDDEGDVDAAQSGATRYRFWSRRIHV
ncbi:hypothetical protein PCASD_07857 [Puccinia coronata f. sp. avenae]|uniref:Mitochondrial import inner membrane translocase subunit Tim21 n=1 Tax=Puccinia coronata f. sp. avenae TaxID=200324 RepID=A0A2N5TFC8_9BASI|nr:hypothetical protein PCASD_14281 [Puccinia coronata f. sp. avenae]PLW40129.1 hypothetical protein PCASD_07857 [Puccinia coronata f. sp. avenae]